MFSMAIKASLIHAGAQTWTLWHIPPTGKLASLCLQFLASTLLEEGILMLFLGYLESPLG